MQPDLLFILIFEYFSTAVDIDAQTFAIQESVSTPSLAKRR